MPASFQLAATRLILLGIGAAVLWEMAARIGTGLVAGRRKIAGPRALVVFGAGLLLGWGMLGPAFLGLALTGLLFPGVVAGVVVVLLAASPASRSARCLILEAGRTFLAVPLHGRLAMALPAAMLVPWLLVPESQQDVFTYHLGAPWQFLQAHRVLLEHVFMDFHLPIPVEMTFVIPLGLGVERLGRWIVLSHFAAVAAIWAGMCLAQGRRTAAWLGSVLALGTAHLPWLMPMSPHASAAAALITAGWLFQRRRAWGMAAILYGLGTAAKQVFGPVAAVLLVLDPPPLRLAMRLAAPLVLPTAVWWIKAFVATGNPVFPLATDLFPTLGWGPRNDAVFLSYMRTLQAPDTFSWAEIPGALLQYLDRDAVFLPLCLPGLLLLGSQRREAWGCALGAAIVLRYGHFSRFLVPAEWILCLLVATEVCRLRTAPRVASALVLAAYVLCRAIMNPALQPVPWRDAGRPLPHVRTAYLETFRDMYLALRETAPPNVMTIGELSSYRIPSRVIFTGMLGQTPAVWDLVRTSWSQDEIFKRYRQLGEPLIVHNVVGALTRSTRYAAFSWETRMLVLYRAFCLRRLELVRAPRRSDTRVGCYYLWRMRSTPRRGAPKPAEAYFLPGTSSLLAPVIILRNQGRYREAIAECERILRILPGLGCVESELGTIYGMAGQWRAAYDTLKPLVDSGVLDSKNFGMLATAATMAGEYETADRVYPLCLDRYRMARAEFLVDWGEMLRLWAEREMREGRTGHARRLLGRSLEILRSIPPVTAPAVSHARSTNLARVTELIQDLEGDEPQP